MRTIILSAGQGKRLLPLTENTPKCLLPVQSGRSMLHVQLDALAECGVRQATVMVGFGAEKVEQSLAENPVPGLEVETCYNPFYKISDNLITCWLAQRFMDQDFVLLNGDTLFEVPVLRQLLAAPEAPLTLAINQKPNYDDDDMKVSLNGGRRLRAVGKKLDPKLVDGESIGLMVFRASGVETFRGALNAAVRDPEAMRAWYLSVVNAMAENLPVQTASIAGLWWGEVDCPQDLADVRAALEKPERKRPARVHPHPSAI